MGNITNLNKICQDLLKGLLPRQKEVIARRFGLESKERETLEAIGQSHQITRERVRQIETDAISKIKPRLKKYSKILLALTKYFKSQGDLKREDLLLSQLGGDKFQNHIYFLLTLADPFSRFSEGQNFYPLWTISPSSLKSAQAANNFLTSYFKEKKTPLSLPKIYTIYKKNFHQKIGPLSEQALLSFIEVSKEIEPGIDNLFGLRDWPEIIPRGIKDKAFLALKKAGKPLHFTEITSLISRLNLPQEAERQALVQTVHNELIRDERFVLVGRGIYALKEWGFHPGFVKDIIETVLRGRKGSMSKEEITKEVLRQRFVKVNTILMNLQDKKSFLRDPRGKYSIKEV
jgi:hypothetical protein